MPPRQISSVTFEHHPTGFGIGHASPRLSWRFSANDSDSKNWTQEAYEIHIRRQNSTDDETYHVKSSESVLVPWPSQALQSREIAWVRVRSHGVVKDEAGRVTKEYTEWSRQVAVEVALLEKGDWTAKLTTTRVVPSRDKTIRPTLFRRVFSLPEYSAPISTARLHITAHGIYEAFINGLRVGDEEMAPGWTSYNHRLVYRTFDVTEHLLIDKSNVIGVEVAEGWFAGHLGMDKKRCIYGDRIAFLAQLEVVFKNGRKYYIASDETWKSHNSPISRSEIYDGEDYDARQEETGWSRDSHFDESAWSSTEELPFPSARLVTSDSPPVRKKEEMSPIRIFKSQSGKTLIDFSQNLVDRKSVV